MQINEYDRKCLLGALHSFAKASERWASRAVKGLTDSELKAAVKFELGESGGMSGEDIAYAYKGSPASVCIGCAVFKEGPEVKVVKGQALMSFVRKEFNIPTPGTQLLLPF